MIGRPTGFNTGATYKIVYGYDAATGRFNKVTWTVAGLAAASRGYGYTANSDLIASRTAGKQVIAKIENSVIFPRKSGHNEELVAA